MSRAGEAERWFRRVLPGLAQHPTLFPYALDLERGLVLLVELDEQDYRNAAFLDERCMTESMQGGWLPWQTLGSRLPPLASAAPISWIFHVGHCGSTLISRLLGELPCFLALREPPVLRTLAELRRSADSPVIPELLSLTLNLLARTYRPEQTSLVKATSDCNNLVGPVLAHMTHSRGVLVYVSLATYLATMLRAEVLREDVVERHAARLADLEQLLGEPIELGREVEPGKLAAVAWLASVARFAEAERAHGDRLLRLDFDAFLAAPLAGLERIVRFYGAEATAAELEELVCGPLMQRYSKDGRQPFDAARRAEELARSRSRHAAEIRAALEWASGFVRAWPPLARLVTSYPLGFQAESAAP
jgi:hypothetical protein